MPDRPTLVRLTTTGSLHLERYTLKGSSMSSIPTFNPNHNPGRAQSWTVREEAARLANQGMSGLAGIMLRDGFSKLPADAILVLEGAKTTLAEVCAEVLAGLDTRKGDKGAVSKVINGTDIATIRLRFNTIQDLSTSTYVVDGRRRLIAALLAFGCGRDGMLDEIQTAKYKGESEDVDAFRSNYSRELAQKLDPWAKVEAGERTLADKPTTTEAELLSVLGVKRGDGQLIHRAATAIRRHKLAIDRSKRCPGKEEWKTILEAGNSIEAAEILEKMQTSVREKTLGVDQVRNALANLPEGTRVDARKLAEAIKSRDGLDAYIASL